MSVLLEARELSVRFRERRWFAPAPPPALDRVSLRIAPGECIGVVGESGSGKTTLVRALLALQALDAGELHWVGRRYDGAGRSVLREVWRGVQAVSQDPLGSLDPRMTAAQSIAEAWLALDPQAQPGRAAPRAHAALAEVGLDAALGERRPHELSGGQCQRVAIARAIVARPRLLVCDEATSALDVSVQAQIVNLLRELQARHGMALLVVSHQLALLRLLCERVLVLQQGRVVEEGGVEQVLERPAHACTAALLAAVPRLPPAAAAVPANPR